MFSLECAALQRHTIPFSRQSVRNHALIVSSDQEELAQKKLWNSARFFATIAEAAYQAQSGDTVYIEGGIYQEAHVTFQNSGTQDGGYIVVCPLPNSGQVILTQDGNEVFGDRIPVFDLNNRAYIKIENLEFSAITDLLACIKMKRASHCVIYNNEFKGIGKSDVSPTYDGNAILLMNNATDCVVSHNLFENCYGDGVCLSEQGTKRNLVCHNTFMGMKGKKRSWSDPKYHYSSAITCSDVSQGYNLIAFNQIAGGLAGIWLDRDGSHNFIVGNTGNGGQRLVFNESRCTSNWIYENKASNMTVAAYSSALYSNTGWSADTRWIGNSANDCKVGFYLHKSMRDTLIANVTKNSSSYCLVFSDSAARHGPHYFAGNEWDSSCGKQSVLYKDEAIFVDDFCSLVNQKPYTLDCDDKTEVTVGRYGMECVSRINVDFDDLVVVPTKDGSYVLRLRLSQPAESQVNILVKVVAGNTLADNHYTITNRQLSFGVGEIEQILPVDIRIQDKEFSKLLVLQITDSEGKLCLGRCYSVVQILAKSEQQATRIDDTASEEGNTIVRTEYFDLNGRKTSLTTCAHSILICKTLMKNGTIKITKIVR